MRNQIQIKLLLPLLFLGALLLTNANSTSAQTHTGTGSGTSGGDGCSFFGYYAGNHNSAKGNTFIGARSGALNTIGNSNSLLGDSSGYSNTSGSRNCYIGYKTGYNGTAASYNTFIGYMAGQNNSASYNTFIGYMTGQQNTSGNYNTFVGNGTGSYNTTGTYNTYFGREAGQNNTTGSYNLFIGTDAGNENTTGSSNSYIGNFAGYSGITCNYNTMSGYTSGYYNTGDSNTFYGYRTGITNTTGHGNTFIGYRADASANNLTNATAIGKFATVNADNKAVIGNASVKSIGGYVNWTNLSDGRYKKNIVENVKGMDFIMKLRPVTYTLDVQGINKALGLNFTEGVSAKEKIVYSGFIAQEVEKSANELGYDFSGVDKPTNDKEFYGIRYADFVVPMVKGMQEQQTKITAIKQQNKELKDQLAELKMKLDQLSQQLDLSGKTVTNTTGNPDAATISQNEPNPWTDYTTISYYLPENCHGSIVISNMNGMAIQQFNSLNPGHGQVHLNSTLLPSGVYYYYLMVNGKQIDNKRMLLISK